MYKSDTISYIKKSLLLAFSVIFLISCGTRQDIVYFQDIDIAAVSKPIEDYSPIIRPDDMLTITVSAFDMVGVRPFNLMAVAYIDEEGTIGRNALQSYLVDAEGNIDFPVLGKLKLAGLTRIEAAKMIKDMVSEYVKNPIVNLRITNFRFTVLGEVKNPGTFTIPNNRITLFEALGMAGDLTIQAERNNVLLVREEGGKTTYNRINLTTEAVFNSPFYYLQQNDFIYVEPNNSRVRSSTVGPDTNFTLGVIGAILTSAALVITVINSNKS
ncbi:MAG: ABC transporter substrate-binding protein [Flavobacteriales bacterium]|nr:MAG: ABC transporter substrate-binding protein [Flavobacteriales bacterium]PIE49271.1 MAG: ABC transporter substrate-binding protein [Flavobacteriales bacterium]